MRIHGAAKPGCGSLQALHPVGGSGNGEQRHQPQHLRPLSKTGGPGHPFYNLAQLTSS